MSALEGASRYLNNLLLARGLLHDGKPIDFVQPKQGVDTNATMPKIINLIHELVLRRDRETERYEAMVVALRNQRAEESQRLLDFQRLQDKNVQLQSDLNTAQASERTARASLKRTDAQVKELKEQTSKIKSTADQVRAKCQSDVRRRDNEIEKLKGHISSFQRGTKQPNIIKISVVDPLVLTTETKERRGEQDTNSLDWSLEKETSNFLAALVNETSTENVALRQIIEGTTETLKDLTGYNTVDGELGDLPSQYGAHHNTTHELPAYETLANHMALVMQHCKTILKDPSFVSIEEVNIRDEEILKLRSGWEKMADRWKEAVIMMSQWRQRMIDEGRTIEAGEFSELSLGRSVAVRPDGQPVLGDDTDLSSIYDQNFSGSIGTESLVVPEEPLSLLEDEESDLDLEPEHIPKTLASSPPKRGLRLPKAARTLTEVSGNATKSRIPTRIESTKPDGLDLSPVVNDDDDHHETTPEIDQSASSQNDKIYDQNSIPRSKTVQEKLEAVEAEAKIAEELRQGDGTRKRKVPPRGVGGRKTKRRSTLRPDELAALMRAS